MTVNFGDLEFDFEDFRIEIDCSTEIENWYLKPENWIHCGLLNMPICVKFSHGIVGAHL